MVKTVALGVLVTWGGACGDGVQPEQRQRVYFSAIETEILKPSLIVDPGPSMPSAQVSSSEAIVNAFVQNRERLLADPGLSLRIEQIENIFMLLGRYHELMAIYRDDWEARKTQSVVADRFAWGLIRLGQRKRSREVIDALLGAHPTDARFYFLDGAAWLQEQPPDPKHFPAIVASWKRAIELDPNFRGYEGINAEMLKGEIARFEGAIPQAPGPAPLPQSHGVGRVDADGGVEDADVGVAESDVGAAESEDAPPPPDPPSPPPELTADERYRLKVARGLIALGRGEYQAAEDAFIAAKALKPEGFEAEFGHLQAGWANVARRNDVAAGMRKLSERKDLTPSQHIDLGVFLWTKLGRKDLATAQWEAARAADPSVAARVKALQEQMK